MLGAKVAAITLYSILVVSTTNPRDLAVSIAKLGVDYRYAFVAYATFRMAPLVHRDLKKYWFLGGLGASRRAGI